MLLFWCRCRCTITSFFLVDLLGATSARTYDVLAGNREWMKRNGLDVTNEMNSILEEQEAQGQTAIMCAIDGRILRDVDYNGRIS